jgi:hypothetical protein
MYTPKRRMVNICTTNEGPLHEELSGRMQGLSAEVTFEA